LSYSDLKTQPLFLFILGIFFTPPQNMLKFYMSFVHLHTHSHYSLLDGLVKIDDLIKEVVRYEMPALALTDHGNLYGAVEFYKKAKAAGIKPIIGVEAYVASGSRLSKKTGIDEKRYHLIILAENSEGYQNLLKLASASYLDGFYYKPRVDKELLRKFSKGLIATSSCLSGEIARTLYTHNRQKPARSWRNIAIFSAKTIFSLNFRIIPEYRITPKFKKRFWIWPEKQKRRLSRLKTFIT
jgi:DNA polymerase III alpha subunit